MKPTREQIEAAITRAHGGSTLPATTSIQIADNIMALLTPEAPKPRRWIVERNGTGAGDHGTIWLNGVRQCDGTHVRVVRELPMPSMEELRRAFWDHYTPSDTLSVEDAIRAVLAACGIEVPK